MRSNRHGFIAGHRLLLAACVTSMCMFASTAQSGDFNRAGVYVGVNGVYAHPLFEDSVQDINPTLGLDDTGGLNARLGLRLLSFIAIEAQYEWIDGFLVSSSTVGDVVTLGAHNLTGNLRLHIPVWRVDPYILGGIGATFWKADFASSFPASDENGTGFAGRVGGGIDFYLTKHIVLNAEVTAALTTRTFDVPSTSQDLDNLYYLSVSAGLVYRF